MSMLEYWCEEIEKQQFNNYAGYLSNFIPWQQFKSHAIATQQMVIQQAERSMNPPVMLISENPTRDYRELFLKANSARRMYRFTAYVLIFVCVALLTVMLCLCGASVLWGH